jgi:hypothetical protein
MAMQVLLSDSFSMSGIRGSVGVASQPTQPLQSDVEEFNKLLGGVNQMASSSTPVASPAATKPIEATAMDTVKTGLQGASDLFKERISRLDSIARAATKSNSISEMLKFQLESMKMGVELDFTGKVVSKAVQDVEQLTRQQ